MKTNLIKVYHLSPNKNRKDILSNGLIPKAFDGTFIKYEASIFVSKSKKDLAFDYVAFEDVDVWEFLIEESKLFKDEHSTQEGHYLLKDKVDSSNLKLLKCY
jgi:hypothetical protein